MKASNRNLRMSIAEETLSILKRGGYSSSSSHATISLAPALEAMRAETELFTPQDLESLSKTLKPNRKADEKRTKVDVMNCTTFKAAAILVEEGYDEPLCLNFASAKNPGGGFLRGSQAQEEALARASGLYASLIQQPDYYQANRESKSALYTNHLIYSPHVPVFRNDADVLMDQPHLVSIITSPAVNAKALRQNKPNLLDQVEPTMKERIGSVLTVALLRGHKVLVLGAWGCGVFGNKPAQIASLFAHVLYQDERFIGVFDRIIFAVLDGNPQTPTLKAFANALQSS